MKKYLSIVFILVFTILAAQVKPLEKYQLMPWPQELIENNQQFTINNNFTLAIQNIDNERMVKASTHFLRRLSNRTGIFINNGFAFQTATTKNASLTIYYDRIGALKLNEDESYTLNITNTKISIKAITDIGALRGLETLLQLITSNKNEYYFPGLTINDFPRFPWRGLMIDVARHFQPIDVLKRNLDAMASVKLNVFHWHLTDDQGFRIESKTYPKLHQMASDGLYYSQEQIKDIVAYAALKGIRVIPEFDIPGHASAILTAYPALGSKDAYTYSIERYAGVFNPTLDPTNEKTYQFLDELFKEITPLFPDNYFHIGGDENEGKHWSSNPKIQKFKEKHHLKTNHDLQTYFNIKLEKILKKYGKSLMGWDEIMTPTMPTTALIHSWRGEHEGLSKGGTLIEAAKKGYKTVLSNGYYIDRMQSAAHHYLTEPIGTIKLTKEEEARILGGEATMWSELVTPLTIDSRIWPRTAAIAERFWSAREINDVDSMYKRLDYISYQLEELGITHLKNSDVILRNITKNKDISALQTLQKVCEPLKIYARNKGGTEYKSFSPFTLFADACTADAQDKKPFKKAINSFVNKQNKEAKTKVLSYLEKWVSNYNVFQKLPSNPILKQLNEPYRDLAQLSAIYKKILQTNTIHVEQTEQITVLLHKLNKPFVDVELVIYNDLKKLANYFNTIKS